MSLKMERASSIIEKPRDAAVLIGTFSSHCAPEPWGVRSQTPEESLARRAAQSLHLTQKGQGFVEWRAACPGSRAVVRSSSCEALASEGRDGTLIPSDRHQEIMSKRTRLLHDKES